MYIENRAIIIYLEDCMLLSKKEYLNWKEVQEEYFEKYKTNLEPMTCEEIISFFQEDFKEERNWPFSRKRIINFFERNDMVIQSN